MPQFDFFNVFIIFFIFFPSFILIETFSFYMTQFLIFNQFYWLTLEDVAKRFEYLLKK
jgi:hypothetical protein